MSDHEELEASVAAWVLSALWNPPKPRRCASTSKRARAVGRAATRLRRAVRALPLAAEEVAPPARLRERDSPGCRGLERMRSLPAPGAEGASAACKGHSAATARPRIPVYAAAAAVLLALLVGVVAVTCWAAVPGRATCQHGCPVQRGRAPGAGGCESDGHRPQKRWRGSCRLHRPPDRFRPARFTRSG